MSPSILNKARHYYAVVAELDKAPASEAEDWWFESTLLRLAVVQLDRTLGS